MKLQPMKYLTGLGAVLAMGPALAWAAEGSAGGLGDNLPVLGVAVALLIFAFTRKPERSAPTAPPVAAEPAVADAAPAAEAEAAEEPAPEVAAEPAVESEQAASEPPESSENTESSENAG
jgi:hypothetical protein